MKKKALGKGIRAFIPEEYGILKEERYADIDIELLKANPSQPRMNFNEQAIDELAQSIRESGILQPIVVMPDENFYRIIIGERRWRAAQKVGLKKVPVLIRTIPAEHQLEVSLIENLQREDLNPLEIAQAYQKIIQEQSYTQQELADRVGKDRSSVTNYLRLLKLPQEIQKYLEDGKITMGHARALLAVEDNESQLSLSRRAVQKNLSVRSLERMISRMKKASTGKKREPDPDLLALQEELLKTLSTKVSIEGSLDKGVIKIHYFSLDELNRIFEYIKGVSL